jgi:hypothetical protein
MEFFKHPMGVRNRYRMSDALPVCKVALAFLVIAGLQLPAVAAPVNAATTNFNKSKSIPATGIVTDENGEALIGVSVAVKGTGTGAQTDASGKFTLDVAVNSTLVFSYVGFKTQEVVFTVKPLGLPWYQALNLTRLL